MYSLVKRNILLGLILLAPSFYGNAETSVKQLFDDKNYEEFFILAETKEQDKEALFLLGKAYHFGLGTPQNIDKAKIFYHKASKLGEPKADNNLGIIYEQENSLNQANEFLQQAYNRGLEDPALDNLARVCLELMMRPRSNSVSSQKIHNDSDKLCAQYNETLYNKNSSKLNLHALSQAKLIAFLYNPRDNENKKEALKWLDEAIQKDIIEAITNKGLYYKKLNDTDKANALFQQAADRGQLLAMFELGYAKTGSIEGLLWYSKATRYGSALTGEEVVSFINRYASWCENKGKLTYTQLETIRDDLQKYIDYLELNALDPITKKPFLTYHIDNATGAYTKLKNIIDASKALDEYWVNKKKNKPDYSTEYTVKMIRQLESYGYIDANVAWKIKSLSENEIFTQGLSSDKGIVDLTLTKPDNKKIIDYLNQGGTLTFTYNQISWILKEKVENGIIYLNLDFDLAKLINQSRGISN